MTRWGSLFNLAGLTPSGLWPPTQSTVIWPYVGSDAVIALSFLAILFCLIRLFRHRPDLSGLTITAVCIAFIVAFATTHGMAILEVWLPATGIERLVETMLTTTSVATASVLWMMAPRLNFSPSVNRLTDANAELSRTVSEQGLALRVLIDTEQTLRHANSVLELEVARRADEARGARAHLAESSAQRVAIRALLDKSEAEHQASFEASVVGKVQLDPLSGNLLRVNATFANMLGYEAGNLVGREIWDLVDLEDRATAHAQFTQLIAQEIDHWVMEKRFVRRDGVPIWVRISGTVVIDPVLGVPRIALAEIEDLDIQHNLQIALNAASARL